MTPPILRRRIVMTVFTGALLTALPAAVSTPGSPGSGAASAADLRSSPAGVNASAAGSPGSATGADRRKGSGDWRAAWAASPQSTTEAFGPNWSTDGFRNHTVRQVVRVSTHGTRARIELSNRYGARPLRISGATVALSDGGARVRPGSSRQLSFDGRRSVAVPAGGTLHSDGVPLKVHATGSVTVTLHLTEPTGPATFHPLASTTSYRATGDHLDDRDGAAFDETSSSWYFLTGVETDDPEPARRDGVVTFGDSLTDGFGSTPGADRRYPDVLAERLLAEGRDGGVVNHGISGNQVTQDTLWSGESGLSRFGRDALDEPGVGTVLVVEGSNDLGGVTWTEAPGGPTPEVSLAQLIAGHEELIRQAHSRGIKVIGGTLPPVKDSTYWKPEIEAKRDAFNDWIRTSGAYDAVVDFDRVLRDPADPDRILPAYDSGDHLHPNDAGYRVMAGAVDTNEL